MQPVQKIEPISSIQNQPTVVLGMLGNGPVILAQRSKPAAVLISVDEWDAIANEIAYLRKRSLLTPRQLEALLQAEAVAARNEPTIPHATLKAQVLERMGHAQG